MLSLALHSASYICFETSQPLKPGTDSDFATISPCLERESQMESMETHLLQNPYKYNPYDLCLLLRAHPWGSTPHPHGLFIGSPLSPGHHNSQTPPHSPTWELQSNLGPGIWGWGEDLPGGEVRGLASPWLLSPFGGFLVPLCLILRLPISRLLGQPHQGSRVMWSEIWGHIKGTSAKTLRLCKELTETYWRKQC